MAEKTSIQNDKSSTEDEKSKLAKTVFELKAHVEKLTLILTTKEAEMVRALDKIVELERRISEEQVNDENSAPVSRNLTKWTL